MSERRAKPPIARDRAEAPVVNPNGGDGRREGSAVGQGDRSSRRGGGGRRHQGRVLAMQVLYEIDLTGHAAADVMARTFDDSDVPAAMRRHVERLVNGVLATRREGDAVIAEVAPAFPVEQLPAVDRNVLRLAIYELLHEPDVPTRAAINEAVELAKRFGGDNSSRFVNGVLGTVTARYVKSGQAAPPRATDDGPTPGAEASSDLGPEDEPSPTSLETER